MYRLDPGLEFPTTNRRQRRGRFLLPPLLLAIVVIPLLAVSARPLLSLRRDAIEGREGLASEELAGGQTPIKFLPEGRPEVSAGLAAGELCASQEATDYAACTSSSPSRQQLLKQSVQQQRIVEEEAEAAEPVVMAAVYAERGEAESSGLRRNVRIRDERGRVTVARLLGT